MSRPLVGISGRVLPLAELAGVPEILRTARAELHLADYARCVAAAGAIPVQLSAHSGPEVVARLDALVLSGGGDIDPARYGAEATAVVRDVDAGRDAHELAWYAAARSRRLPVLGICRGQQLINVAHGGTLHLDLPTDRGEPHASFTHPRDARVVSVATVAGSRLAAWYGALTRVNCLHHQAVDRVGEGLVVTARASDGVIEGLEQPGADVVAVQWHPEMFSELEPCFHWLAEAARRRRAGRG